MKKRDLISKSLFFFFALYLTPFAYSTELSPKQKITWNHLLHFKNRFLLGPKSIAGSPEFFLAPNGKLDAEAELKATLEALEQNNVKVGALKQPAACAFPARKQFLEQELNRKFPKQDCPELEAWKRGIGAEKITLVFSSAYPNNPAAMFGHTLLRLDRKQEADTKRNEKYMSYGVAFTANIPEGTNDFSYAFNGLLGGFAGVFGISPYYTLVNDYTNAEMRDLWEYPLKLSKEQVEFVVNHLWELYTNTYFDYYFFTRNCSTLLLSLLQVGLPEKDLFENLPFYTLPIDAIHQLKALDLLEEPMHRASSKKKLDATRKLLRPEEVDELEALLEEDKSVEHVQSATVLDAAAAYWNYRKFLQSNLKDSREQSELHRILVQRARLGKQPERALNISRTTQPDLGHYSSAASISSGVREDELTTTFSYRLGMHDLLNRETGFEPFSQIDFIAGAVSYLPERNKFRFREFRFFEATSLYPLGYYDRKLSWKLSIRGEQMEKRSCDACQRAVVEGGGGLSVHLFSENDLWYSLLLGRAAYSSQHFPKPWDLGLGTQSGILYRWSEKHRSQLEARGEWDFHRSFHKSWFWIFSYAQAYGFNQQWEVRGKIDHLLQTDGRDTKGDLTLTYFF